MHVYHYVTNNLLIKMINQLTFTRFIAALAIVIFHYGTTIVPFSSAILLPLFKNANIGVSYFFILSGFVMIIAYGKKTKSIEKKEYYINRIARIYPVYILALLFMALILFIRFRSIDFTGLLLGSLTIQSWFPKYASSLNTPGWSLSVEFLFYLLFPFLLNHAYKKYNLQVITVCVLFFWLISQIVFNYLWLSPFYTGYPSASHSFLFYFPLMHLNEFLIGNLMGLFFLNNNKKRNYDHYLVLLFLLICFIVIIVDTYKLPVNFHNGLMAILFGPFILILALNTGKITKLFSYKIFVILGEISYGMYIYQYPAYTLISYLGKTIKSAHPDLFFYAFFIILLVTSFISYYLIEIPLRRLIKAKP